MSLRIILELTRLHGDKPYLVYRDEHMTYAEHYRKAASLAIDRDLIVRIGMHNTTRPAAPTGLTDAHRAWVDAEATAAGVVFIISKQYVVKFRLVTPT